MIARLDAGDDIALVSDAGTPLIADPGAYVVAAVRAAGHRIVPVPGPSSMLAAVVASGLVPGPFTFLGFLPQKRSVRRAAIERIRALPHPAVLFEAPHRIAATMTDALDLLGDRTCAVCRELTKLHEEIVVTTLSGAVEGFVDRPPRGEYVIIITEAPSRCGNRGRRSKMTHCCVSLLEWDRPRRRRRKQWRQKRAGIAVVLFACCRR